MSTRDISENIQEIYGFGVSAETISNITNRVLVDVKEWQSRALKPTYAVIFMDGMVFKVEKDGVIQKCTAYACIGVDLDGQKEVLSLHYVRAKIHASQTKDAAKRVDTGVTRYNLIKNDVLTSLLKKTGFSELCVRFVTQESEHRAFKEYRRFNAPGFREIQESKKMILYQGVDIIGAAEFCDFGHNYFEIMFVKSDTDEGFLKLISVIENWIKIRTTIKLLLVRVSRLDCDMDEQPLYESL